MIVTFDNGMTEKDIEECSKQELIEMRAEIRIIQKNIGWEFELKEDESNPIDIKGNKFNPMYDSKIMFISPWTQEKRYLVETYDDEIDDLCELISNLLKKKI